MQHTIHSLYERETEMRQSLFAAVLLILTGIVAVGLATPYRTEASDKLTYAD